MKTKSITTIFIYNFLVLALWVGLAFMFNHWWIALFSILFMCFPKTIPYHYRICDCCGTRSRPAETKEAAVLLAESDGWVHNSLCDTDYCPTCRNKKSVDEMQEQ